MRCSSFNRHCWEALISSSCVGTVMWQHWQCIILIQEMFSLLELGQSGDVIGCTWKCFESGPSSPTHQNRWDFLTIFFAKVAPGVCWNLLWVWICPRTESGKTRASKRRERFIPVYQCIMSCISYVVYTDSNKTTQSLPQIQLVSGLWIFRLY